MKMSEKRVNWPSNWSPQNENTENIASIELPQEIQRELDCTVGEYVFLEYPWAFVCRKKVMQQANKIDSPLYVHKDKIEIYKSQWFLIGYASNELIANSFIICLTDEARDSMVKRNRDITRNIVEKVRRMITKTSCSRVMSPKSEENVSWDSNVNRSRSQVEVELSVKISALKRQRQLTDRDSDKTHDSYIDLIPTQQRKFHNIRMKQVSKFIQTTLEARDTSVQSFSGDPKNKWTQYNDLIDVQSYEVIDDKNENDEDVNRLKRPPTHDESSSAGLSETITENREIVKEIVLESEIKPQRQLQLLFFLQSHLSQIIDYVGYNSKINIHLDDIVNLMKCNSSDFHSMINADCYLFKESCSLMDFNITKGRVISDVSWHQDLVGLVAISYVDNPRCQVLPLEQKVSTPSDSFHSHTDINVLIWSLNEPLYPKLRLNDSRAVQLLSFCPVRASILVGGCTNGQLVLWNLQHALDDLQESNCSHEIPVFAPIAASDPDQSHLSAICALQWLPSHYRIECDGTLNKLPENVSMQFMTCSDDGTVAIWDLLWQPSLSQGAKNLKSIVTAAMSLTDDLERLDGVFRPHYRLYIQLSKESINMTFRNFCLSYIDDSDDDSMKFWVSTVQGEIALCTWHGEEYEVTGKEYCEIIDHSSCVHDGPVIDLIRSPHIKNVLLTIGGSVFAIWHGNYLRHPIIWRRRDCNYSACCWSHRPGVFIIARCDGDLETWDLYRKTKQPVYVQTISGRLITGLYTHDLSNIIGICHDNGIFKFVNEVIENESDHHDRIDWFSKFIDREVERKNEFYGWQDEYLMNNERVLEKKALRVTEEAKRRHEEAKEKFLKEQEEQARIRAERKNRNIVPSKETVLRAKNIERMTCTLLKKKGFDPESLDRMRYPLVQQQVEKTIRMNKAREKVRDKQTYFTHASAIKFPECIKDLSKPDIHETAKLVHADKRMNDIIEEYRCYYMRISCEAKKILEENPCVPIFNWNSVMKERECRRDYANIHNFSI